MRKLRRSQVVGPFGPGAIVDLLGESFVAEDAGQWRNKLAEIDFPRLARYLGVDKLKTALPGGALPYLRFPRTLFCFRCRAMVQWTKGREQRGQPPTCTTCPGRRVLIPMRFVAACADGHLTDVDWRRWAHSASRKSRDQNQCASRDLLFNNRADAGGGLASLVVQCRKCKAFRSLLGITNFGGIPQRCPGTQPWQSQVDAVTCSKPLVSLQRGASNIYFPTIHSAIDIPPDSDWREIDPAMATLTGFQEFKLLVDRASLIPAIRQVALDHLVHQTQFTAEEIMAEVDVRRGGSRVGTVDDIRPDEWVALRHPHGQHDPRDRFIARRAVHPSGATPIGGAEAELARVLADIVLVERLREVRVLTEFKRYKMESAVPANIGDPTHFLPAAEVYGEGYFLRFAEEAIAEWETRPRVRAQVALIAKRMDDFARKRYPEPTPRFILMHTFAHLLLRQTAFEAGYSTSSLRERLYVTPKTRAPAMAGILIYTAAGDSEGTLGGLVRMGQPERLWRLLSNAVSAAQWCSFDPVCGESKGQGPDGLSLAACHACALVPETSCDQSANRLLDRSLLVDEDYGFFAPLAGLLGPLPSGGIW
ncbi:hypothetical protein Acsp05_72370 [Actinokineospora sp. NBRC 105648]|nr:hypothetical protein Acsp05_72370 [Actinokineospora sp. NBRC 105648]